MAYINGKETLFSAEVNFTEGEVIDPSKYATKEELDSAIQDLARAQNTYLEQTLTNFESYMDEKHASKEELREKQDALVPHKNLDVYLAKDSLNPATSKGVLDALDTERDNMKLYVEGQISNIPQSGGGANVVISDTEPVDAPAGTIWIDTTKYIVFYANNSSIVSGYDTVLKYTAEEGMTLREWVHSKYNVDNWRCYTEFEETPEGDHIYGITNDTLGIDLYLSGANDWMVDCDSVIIPNYTYDTWGRP